MPTNHLQDWVTCITPLIPVCRHSPTFPVLSETGLRAVAKGPAYLCLYIPSRCTLVLKPQQPWAILSRRGAAEIPRTTGCTSVSSYFVLSSRRLIKWWQNNLRVIFARLIPFSSYYISLTTNTTTTTTTTTTYNITTTTITYNTMHNVWTHLSLCRKLRGKVYFSIPRHINLRRWSRGEKHVSCRWRYLHTWKGFLNVNHCLHQTQSHNRIMCFLSENPWGHGMFELV